MSANKKRSWKDYSGGDRIEDRNYGPGTIERIEGSKWFVRFDEHDVLIGKDAKYQFKNLGPKTKTVRVKREHRKAEKRKPSSSTIRSPKPSKAALDHINSRLVPEGSPAVGQTISGHCEAKTIAGKDCPRNASQRLGDKSYCAQHAKDHEKTSGRSAARQKYLREQRRKDGYYY